MLSEGNCLINSSLATLKINKSDISWWSAPNLDDKSFEQKNTKVMNHSMGKYLFIIGLIIALAGLLLWLWPSKWSGLGNLPGDIRIEKENFRLYIPVTTSLLISVVISLIIFLVRKISSWL